MKEENETTNDYLRRRYETEIEAFFNGQTYYNFSRLRGNVWVSRRRHVDTLVVEPPEGGQYEIAVRWHEEDGGKIVGYVVSDHGLAGYRIDH